VGIGRGSVDRERVYAPTWAGPLSKLGQNVSTNGLNSPDTYWPKYHICFIYFIFRYSLDMYPRRIRYVSDTYPSRIGEFGDVSVFCISWCLRAFLSGKLEEVLSPPSVLLCASFVNSRIHGVWTIVSVHVCLCVVTSDWHLYYITCDFV
jgi:hypothetical protein